MECSEDNTGWCPTQKHGSRVLGWKNVFLEIKWKVQPASHSALAQGCRTPLGYLDSPSSPSCCLLLGVWISWGAVRWWHERLSSNLSPSHRIVMICLCDVRWNKRVTSWLCDRMPSWGCRRSSRSWSRVSWCPVPGVSRHATCLLITPASSPCDG